MFVVFLYHALSYELVGNSAAVVALRKTVSFGWAGVDVFFVLSGFLITTILLDARETANYFKVFYARRALRIMPLYYLVLVGSVLLEPGHYGVRAQFWYWLNLSNLPTAFHPFIIPFLAHFWSLAIEEQFYLVWPTLVRHLRVRHIAALCGTVILAVFAAKNFPFTLHMNARYPEFVYRLTPYRVDTLCGGALLALTAKYRPHWLQHRGSLWGALLLGVCVFAAAGGNYKAAAVIRFGYSALLLASCALIALSLFPESVPSRFFSNRALRTLGRYSYSFYLFHPILVKYGAEHLSGVQRRAPFLHTANQATLFLLPFEFSVVLGASALSWRFLEEPILAAKRHFRYQPRPEHYLA